MRYLLDKNIIRKWMELSLQGLEKDLISYLNLFPSLRPELFISIETQHILVNTIQHRLRESVFEQTGVFYQSRYLKRWARRLREHSFSPEDAKVLAYGSLGTNEEGDVLGVHEVVLLTFCDKR